MNLADLDRHRVTWRYEAWDQDLVFRPLSAKQLLALRNNGLSVDQAMKHGGSVSA